MRKTVLFIFAFAAMFVTACAAETASTEEQTSASIQQLQRSENGFTATITRGEAKVTIDLQRAAREHMELIADPPESSRLSQTSGSTTEAITPSSSSATTC